MALHVVICMRDEGFKYERASKKGLLLRVCLACIEEGREEEKNWYTLL